MAEIEAAESALGFAIPPLLRRLYTEVGNGHWGPTYGLLGIPTSGNPPDENDIVGRYQLCTAHERALESPAVEWPHGLVEFIDLGCVSMELCDFIHPPYAVTLLDGDNWDLDRPLIESLTPIASSLEKRLETWLAAPGSRTRGAGEAE